MRRIECREVLQRSIGLEVESKELVCKEFKDCGL